MVFPQNYVLIVVCMCDNSIHFNDVSNLLEQCVILLESDSAKVGGFLGDVLFIEKYLTLIHCM